MLSLFYRPRIRFAWRLSVVCAFIACLVICLSRAEGQQNQLDSAANTASSPHQYTLANGLKVILLPDRAYPYICFSTWYKVGSKDDPARMTGLTHLVEHLLFQNVGNYQSNQLIDLIVRNGGEFSGFTSEDFTALYANLPSSELELAVHGLSDCMRNAHFTKDNVQTEISQLVKESAAEDEDQAATLNKEVHALAYEQHPYHNPPGGWPNELEHLTYDQARAHYDHFFQPNNACLVLAGGFDEKNAAKLIDKYFASLPKVNNLPAKVYTQERPQLAERQIKLKAQGNKESVMVAYKVPGISDAETPVFAVLEQLFNGQPHGRLHSKLVESGLCTSAQANFELKHDPGLFIIKCSGIPTNGSTRIVQALDSFLNQLKTKPLSDNEVSQVLKQTEFAYYHDGDGPYAAVFQAGFFDSLGNEQANFWPQRLRQVTSASILQASKHYLNDENRVLGKIIVSVGLNNKPKTTEIDNRNTDLIASSIHTRLAAYQDSVSNYQQASAATNGLSTRSQEHNLITSGQISHKLLNNGINVIVVESHLKPIISIYGTVKAGSIFDKSDCRGQAKLMTAVFNSGTASANKQQSITEQEDLGLPPHAMLNFNCRMENITFGSRCLNHDLETQLRRLFITLSQPRIQAAEFDGQKNDLLVKLRLSESNNEERIRRAMFSSLIANNCAYYPLHPEQEIESIANLKINDVQDFYRAHVNPAATTLIIAGDVDPKQTFHLIEDITHDWANVPAPQTDTQTNTVVAEDNVQSNNLQSNNVQSNNVQSNNIKSGIEKTKSSFALRLIPANHQAFKSSILLPHDAPSEIILGRLIPLVDIKQPQAAWVALQIADCVLSTNPIFSRLAVQFEAKPELLADMDEKPWNTKMMKLANNLIWSIQIKLKSTASAPAAIIAIQDELEQFGQTGLTATDLGEARRYLAGSISIRDCFNLDKLAHFVFYGFNDLNEIDLLARTKKVMMALNSNDMNQFITRLFKPQSSTLVVAGPRQLVKQIQPIREAAESD